MHFCNATRTFSFGKCSAYIFQRKMFSCAKMHLMQKCIFAYILRSKMFSITFSKGKCSTYIFQRKMFSITFYFVKCSASHFPKENVQHLCFLQSKKHSIFPLSRCPYILLVLNIFLWKMFSITFCYTKGYKCIFASHFPKENVQQSKMLESGQHKKQQTQHFCTVTMLTQCFFLVISYLTLFSIKDNLLTKSLLKIILVISLFGLFRNMPLHFVNKT